ncbi:molybdopterin dinucleotide binding domain-containing protein [Georgenia sp. SUBG003]|uniref:molybdopterin dinucleotide binding domain-containing protein n=1 Tax=Georgenia sp. SUBG003 TaxID=1497974 RepID=UPI003AB109DD
MRILVSPVEGGAHLRTLPGGAGAGETVASTDLPDRVRRLESEHRPRWVWADTAAVYPPLLRAGVRVERCQDLRLCHAILRHAVASAGSEIASAPDGRWDHHPGDAGEPTLLDAVGPEVGPEDVLAECVRQDAAVGTATEPGRLRLLLAAESAGALLAAEMAHDGLPWDRAVHDQLLTDLLGPRPAPGTRPERVEALADRIRRHLDAPGLNPDSPAEPPAGAAVGRHRGDDHAQVGARPVRPSRDRAAARVQEALPAAHRERVGLDGRLDPAAARRRTLAVPPRLRPRRGRHRPVGDERRRGAAAAQAGPRRGRGGPGLAPRRRRRRTLAGTAHRPVVRLSPETAAGLGVVDGDRVTVTGPGGSVTLPLSLTTMPAHVVWLPENSPGSSVHDMLGAGAGAVVALSAAEVAQ